MAQHASGLPQANRQSSDRREEAKEQGLAEQNVTGASPPDTKRDANPLPPGGNVTKPAADESGTGKKH